MCITHFLLYRNYTISDSLILILRKEKEKKKKNFRKCTQDACSVPMFPSHVPSYPLPHSKGLHQPIIFF